MDVIGGGILVAVAAALWIVYLLPSWLGRRQYLATERNAVRLQQTLRILAETAETPEPVRIEATAREVAAQQRILQQREAAARLAAEAAEQEALAELRAAAGAADAARGRAAEALIRNDAITEPIGVVEHDTPAADSSMTEESAEVTPPVTVTAAAAAAARRRLRRKRALCSLALLVSLITAIAGGIASAFGSTLIVPAVGALGVVLAFSGIARLARVRPAVAERAEPSVEVEAVAFEPIELPEAEPLADGWTPRPLPRPLHLSRGTIAAMAMASIEAAAELKRAEAGDDLARRAAELEPEVPSIRPVAPAAASADRARRAVDAEREDVPTSPYARMGIVDDARPGIDDLDAVLRRRRQAG